MFAWWYQGQVEIMVSHTCDAWCGYGDRVHLCAATVSHALPDFVEVSFVYASAPLEPASSISLRIPGQTWLRGHIRWKRGSAIGVALDLWP